MQGHDNAVDLLADERLRTSAGDRESGVDPHVWLDPRALRAHRREDRRRARAAGTARRARATARSPRRGVPQWARALRATRDRHEPRGVRLSRACVRPRAGRPAGLVARGRAEPAGARDASWTRSRSSGSTTVFSETLVSPRLAQTVAREAGVDDCGARPDRGARQGRGRPPGTTTSRSCGAISPRCGRRSDVASRRARRTSRSATGPGSAFSRTSTSRSARESSSRSPGRTAEGRRRSSGSCSGSSARRRGTRSSSASRRIGSRAVGSLGYLAQRSELGGDAPATVREVVSAGRLAAGGLIGPMRRRDRAIVAEAIERVGLGDSADASDANALGRDAAARVHRQGARRPAVAPRARRADDGGRRGVAGVARRAPRSSCTRTSA